MNRNCLFSALASAAARLIVAEAAMAVSRTGLYQSNSAPSRGLKCALAMS